jgi:hypothetical protein
MRKYVRLRNFDIVRLPFFMLLTFFLYAREEKQKKDTMIQDGPPDIPENIQLTA